MKPGEIVTIKAMVLRVEGNRVDAQTADGQLIQTHVSNAENQSVKTSENKGVLTVSERKSRSK